MTSETEYNCINCGQKMVHTRAKPLSDTLAWLVRFGWNSEDQVIDPMHNGEYVLYSAAAAVIAELGRLYNEARTERIDMMRQRRRAEERAEAAEAELAQLKKAIEIKGGNEHTPTQYAFDAACTALNKKTEELAKIKAQEPVSDSLKAENERLREALLGMVEVFNPYSWGSPDNKKDALNAAEAALNVEASNAE